MLLWSGKMCEITSALLNLLRLILVPGMWSAPETEPCILEKNVNSVRLTHIHLEFLIIHVIAHLKSIDKKE